MKRTMIGYLRRSKANKKRPEDPAYGIEAQRTIIERAAAGARRGGWSRHRWRTDRDGA
jgi:hypothetical protein